MSALLRQLALILFIGVVVLAPTFEFFDEGQDLEQGTDLVLVLLSLFTAAGLFMLCKTVICILVRLSVATIPAADAPLPLLNRSIGVDVSPPESLIVLGSLRI